MRVDFEISQKYISQKYVRSVMYSDSSYFNWFHNTPSGNPVGISVVKIKLKHPPPTVRYIYIPQTTSYYMYLWHVFLPH